MTTPTTPAAPTAPTTTVAADLSPGVRAALADLLRSMADDEFVIGFMDSEWTGIAPLLEEDVAMSSIAQDELGHARALFELLAGVLDDGRDADALAYDREPADYRHCRLLDHGRGDWADTIARRVLYELADEARLASIGGGLAPLADLVAKIRREERYHVMHADAWLRRLASEPSASARLAAALDRLAADAATVLAPLPGERDLLAAGVLARPFADAEAAWRVALASRLEPIGLPMPAPLLDVASARTAHGPTFAWLWGEFTSVRRSDPGATW